MALRISIVILIIALFFLAESFTTGTPNPDASPMSELLPALIQPR